MNNPLQSFRELLRDTGQVLRERGAEMLRPNGEVREEEAGSGNEPQESDEISGVIGGGPSIENQSRRE